MMPDCCRPSSAKTVTLTTLLSAAASVSILVVGAVGAAGRSLRLRLAPSSTAEAAFSALLVALRSCLLSLALCAAVCLCGLEGLMPTALESARAVALTSSYTVGKGGIAAKTASFCGTLVSASSALVGRGEDAWPASSRAVASSAAAVATPAALLAFLRDFLSGLGLFCAA